MTPLRGGGLGVKASLLDADIRSLLLARELGDQTDISLQRPLEAPPYVCPENSRF